MKVGNEPAAGRPHVVLETARLRLREMTPHDIDFVATMLGNAEVSRYYDRVFTRYDSEIWLQRQLERYQRDGHGLWLAEERATGEPVGQIGLAVQDVRGVRLTEVGWLLHRPYWGRGYATEAGAASCEAAFGRWHYPMVISLIRPVNVRSQRVAERVGLSPGPIVQFLGLDHIMYELKAGRVRT